MPNYMIAILVVFGLFMHVMILIAYKMMRYSRTSKSDVKLISQINFVLTGSLCLGFDYVTLFGDWEKLAYEAQLMLLMVF